MNKHVAAVIVQRQAQNERTTFKSLPLRWRAASEATGGAACGLVLPLIFTPAELLKCKNQVLRNRSTLRFERRQGAAVLGDYTEDTLQQSRAQPLETLSCLVRTKFGSLTLRMLLDQGDPLPSFVEF